MADVTFHLRDRGGEMVAAWERHFAGVANVLPAVGDIFGAPVDAVVSPANCFGFMDGGIDRAYCARFGWSIQDRVRELIARDWDGELPIGLAVVVETGAPDVRYLLAAPTVRAPASVANTLNAYLSFRAVLRAIRKLNAANPARCAPWRAPGWAPAPAKCLWDRARSRCAPRGTKSKAAHRSARPA
jgi:hypothetical protein